MVSWINFSVLAVLSFLSTFFYVKTVSPAALEIIVHKATVSIHGLKSQGKKKPEMFLTKGQLS